MCCILIYNIDRDGFPSFVVHSFRFPIDRKRETGRRPAIQSNKYQSLKEARNQGKYPPCCSNIIYVAQRRPQFRI